MGLQALRQGRVRGDRQGGDGGHLHKTLRVSKVQDLFLVGSKYAKFFKTKLSRFFGDWGVIYFK